MSSAASVVPHVVYIHNYLHLVGVVILYYDWLLTYREEYWRIWKHPRSMSAILFFINRYIPIIGDIAVNAGNFSIFSSEAVRCQCRHYAFFRQLLLIINQVVVCYILFLRTFALYGRNWRVGSSILLFAGGLLGISCWSIVGQHSTIELRGGCHTALDHPTAVRIAVSWECLFVFDLTIFALTIYKTYRERRRGPTSSGRNDIVALIMRDGALYFAVMATANLANTLTFYLAAPLLRGCLSTAASSISVTMMSRLMLNLHASAGPRVLATTHVPGSSGESSDNSTTLLFTSRFSMPPTTTIDQEFSRFRETAYISSPRHDGYGGYGRDGYIEDLYEMQDTAAPHHNIYHTHDHDPDKAKDDDDNVLPLHAPNRIIGVPIIDR